jgi:hypothetical protein
LIFVLVAAAGLAAQRPLRTEIARLRPNEQLVWRKVSPTVQQPGGPVLYQIIFRSNATPNHIPKISNNHTLIDSLLSDNGSQVAIGNLAITSSGVISFANGQSFPGTVTGVSAGDGSIAIGGSGSEPTVSVAADGITDANIADGVLSPSKIAGIAAILDGNNFFQGAISAAELQATGNGASIGLVGQGFLQVGTNSNFLRIGDVGCSTGFLGLEIVAFDDCAHYALVTNGLHTFLNVPSGGDVGFRINNVSNMTMDSSGNIHVIHTLTKGAGSFMIDHPLDPANKYLYHSFVESPDMMNIYNGNLVLDGNGEAVVTLPDWFGALNRDLRYQLTAIGAPGPNLYIADEISNNRFKIAGGRPGGKVSWQVTGIRQDAYANAHRIPVEQDKPAEEKGTYLHPELFGAPPEKSAGVLHGPTAARSSLPASSIHQETR